MADGNYSSPAAASEQRAEGLQVHRFGSLPATARKQTCPQSWDLFAVSVRELTFDASHVPACQLAGVPGF